METVYWTQMTTVLTIPMLTSLTLMVMEQVILCWMV